MSHDNQPNPPTPKKSFSAWWYIVLVLAIGLVITIWSAYWRYGIKFVPGAGIADKGQFGDMFGALNALFSALAFAVILFTVILQIKQLRDQQAELAKTEELQRKSTEALKKQAEANELSAKLSALDSMVQAISRQIEHCKENSPELSFLRLELNAAIGDLRNLIRSQNIFSDLPNSNVNDVALTRDDIVDLFSKHISYLSADDIKSRMSSVFSQLIRSGVNTRKRLETVLHAKHLINLVERLYLEELFRPPHKPLDPDAIATWVVTMFVDPTPQKLDQIRMLLKNSNERKEKNDTPNPPFRSKNGDTITSQRVIVEYPGKNVQPFEHFNYASEQAANWVKENPKATEKPKIYYFDFDMKAWKEARW